MIWWIVAVLSIGFALIAALIVTLTLAGDYFNEAEWEFRNDWLEF